MFLMSLPLKTDKDLKTDGFSQEACRSMVNLMDVSFHGFISLSEALCIVRKRYIATQQKVNSVFLCRRCSLMSPLSRTAVGSWV